MADKTKLQQQTIDLVAAYDERTRLFQRLRDQTLTDEQLTELHKEYADAAKNFDKARAAIVKP